MKKYIGFLMAVLVVFGVSANVAQAYSYARPTVTNLSSNSNINTTSNSELQALLDQLRALLGAGAVSSNWYVRPSDNSEVDVETIDAEDIKDDEATLVGEIDFNNSDEAEVWFEYGEESWDLDERSDKEDLDDNDDEEFEIDIEDLDEDTRYYYRAVAEDEDGIRTYGDIESFRTDDDDNDEDEPEVETFSAKDIEQHSAELRGEVDMNDFEDGIVFFVYGEDEGAVEDVEDEDEYKDIDEDGDDLQKVKVDSGLDNSDTFEKTVYSLDDDTDHYFRICVEYEDEDNDETLECGDIEEFETYN